MNRSSPDAVSRDRRQAPAVSVAVPLYNEEANLSELILRVGEVLDGLPGGPHEMVLVDDGSRDRTRELLIDASHHEPRLRAVLLSRNFGHQAALSAALDHVRGDVAVLMDGDLQDPPEEIPRFIEQYAAGYDVVYARRVRRKEPLWLRLSYSAFYRLLARLAEIPLPRDAGDFALLSRRVVDLLCGSPERNRYLRGLRAWVGFRQIGLEVERDARAAGESKYTLSRLIGLGLDGIFSFSVIPIRLVTVLGMTSLAIAVGVTLYAIFAKLFYGTSPQGFTALLTTIVFLSGAILVSIGVIGEYVGRVYEEVKRRPLYVVERVYDSAPETRQRQASAGAAPTFSTAPPAAR